MWCEKPPYHDEAERSKNYQSRADRKEGAKNVPPYHDEAERSKNLQSCAFDKKQTS